MSTLLRKITFAFVLLLVGGTMVACGGYENATPVPEGWSIRYFEDLEMALPDSWVYVNDTSGAMDRVRSGMKESNPSGFAQLEKLSAQISPSYVYAAFDSDSKRYLVQMSVAKGTTGIATRIPLLDYAKIVQKQLANADIDLTIVGKEQIGGIEAVKVATVINGALGTRVHFQQSGLIFNYDKTVYSMFITYLDSDSPKYASVFNTAVTTLRKSP